MWRDEFAVSVSREFVRTCETPLLVLPGTDRYHPAATGREIAALAPWKDSAEHTQQAVDAIRSFLLGHPRKNWPASSRLLSLRCSGSRLATTR
jgi:hypothetical protein